jgi:capsid protein
MVVSLGKDMLTQIRDYFLGKPEKIKQIEAMQAEIMSLRRGRISASYDAAQTATDNVEHWARSDYLSPNASNKNAIRKKLRSRSRYELVENNPYLNGMLYTYCGEFIQSGPTLTITDKRLSDKSRERIEMQFTDWADEINLRKKLWRLRVAKLVDGEAFAMIIYNPKVDHPIKMDLKLIEADQVDCPLSPQREREYDGVRFDYNDNAEAYYVYDSHPGEQFLYNINPVDGSWINDDYMVHWFRQTRGWLRGIPELTPSLPLCAYLRRYTLAVLAAAELAADYAVVLESLQPAASNGLPNFNSNGEALSAQPFENFPIDRGMFTVLPSNTKLAQMKPEQPVTVYDIFVNALIKEIARPLCMPFNMASGNSGGYNFASGTLDRQLFQSTIDMDRLSCNEDVLTKKIFKQWWFLAQRTPDVLGAGSYRNKPKHKWGWDSKPTHQDPLRNAESLVVLKESGILSDKDIQEKVYNRSVREHYQNIKHCEDAAEQEGLEMMPSPGSRFDMNDPDYPEGNSDG